MGAVLPGRFAARALASEDPRRRARQRSAALGALTGLALAAVASRGLGDDSWISLDYARNLAERGEWALTPGLPANTATSPLNVVLLATVQLVVPHPAVAVAVVLAIALGAIGWWLRALADELRLSPCLAPVGIALLATSPVLTSTVGLETYLGVAALVGVTRFAVVGRAVWTGVLCGLAILTRPDLVVPAGVCVVVLLAPRRWALAAAVAIAVVVPWHLFAWVALGGFLPDTVALKSGVRSGDDLLSAWWGVYGPRTPARVAVAIVGVLAGWGCVAWWVARHRDEPGARVATALAAAGAAHWLVLGVIGAAPQVWYYGPVAAGAALALAVTVAARPVAWTLSAVAAMTAVSLQASGRGGLPWTSAGLNSNWTDAEHYAVIGRDVGDLVGDAVVLAPGEIGVLAWHCRCRMVDHLADPGLARPYLVTREEQAGPIMRGVLRANRAGWDDAVPTRPAFRLDYIAEWDALPPGVLRVWEVPWPPDGTPFRVVLRPF